MYPGGFQQQGQNSPYPPQSGHPPQTGYPPQGGYPPHGGEMYPPAASGHGSQNPGYPPQHVPYPSQPSGYPNQQSGYPPHPMPGMQQGSSGQVPYPPAGGLPYGLAPGATPGQPAGYGAGGPGYPPQQPYGYPGGQQQFPPSSGPMGYPGQNIGVQGQQQQIPASGSTVELSVSASGLKDTDLMSKSDPVCVLFEKRVGRWEEIGRTEMIENNHNPRWQKKFMLSNTPQSSQQLKFEVFDWDSKSQNLQRHDILGQVETTLSSILSAPGKEFTSSLKRGGGGRITVLAEEVNTNARERIRIQLLGTKLDSKDTFGKSDPYFNMMKKMPNGQWSLVYTSEVIKNNANPRWNGVEKPVAEICNGDYNRELKIEIFDYDSSGENDLIGEFTTNLRSLSTATSSGTKYEVINSKKQRSKRHYKNSGTVSVAHFQSL